MARPRIPVDWVRLDDLVAADRNPRVHDVEGVAASIRRFGYVDFGVLDRRTDKVIGGHGRSKSLRWLRDRGELPGNWDCKRPNVRVDAEGVWWVPVAVTYSENDSEAEALLIALNPDRPGRPGWDIAGLAEMLDDLRDTPGGLIGTGYDDTAVDQLLASIRDDPPVIEEGGTEPALGNNTEFRVLVLCPDETAQATLAEELEQRGYTVQLQMS